MVVHAKKTFRLLWSTEIKVAFLLVLVSIISDLLINTSLIRLFKESTKIEYDILLNLMFTFFMVCSILLMSIIIKLAMDSKKLKPLYRKFFSKLVARDYYKEINRPDYDKAFTAVISNVPERAKEDGTDVKELERISANEMTPWELPEDEDKSDGWHRIFYKNEQLARESFYKDGSLDGTWRSFYEDGTLHQEKHYKSGKLHGLSRACDEQGVLYFEIQYKDGVQNGHEKIFFANGNLHYLDIYEEGRKVSRKVFSETGELLFKEEFG